MVNQLDTSALDPGGFKSLRDVQVANALQSQKIDAGNIDNASKANIYATQVLSAATAGGNQNLYDSAKAHLANSGINVNDWAPDVQTAAQQAQAARLAQSPLGSLLNAAGKMDTNALTYGAAAGQLPDDPNGIQKAFLSGGGLGGNQTTTARAVPQGTGAVPPPPIPVNIGEVPANNATSLPEASPMVLAGNNALPQGGADNAIPAITPAPSAVAAPANPAAVRSIVPIDANGSTATQFVPPPRGPRDTETGYQNAYNQAHTAWENNAEVKKAATSATSSGTKQGEEIGDTAKMVTVMTSNLPAVLGRFQKMRDAAVNASDGLDTTEEGGGIAPAWAVFTGNTKTTDANALLKQASGQQILGEMGPQLAAAGGIKGNRFVETLSKEASGLDMRSPPETKTKLIDGLQKTYIDNLKANAKQLRDLGQPAPTDDEIDAQVKEILPSYQSSLPPVTGPEVQAAAAQSPAAAPTLNENAQAMFNLAQKGFSPEKIQEYLRIKGGK